VLLTNAPEQNRELPDVNNITEERISLPQSVVSHIALILQDPESSKLFKWLNKSL